MQRELERIVEILFQEFDDAMRLATSERKKAGRILKIILFGSVARGTWVDDPDSGFLSDYDLLVIVNHEDLVDAACWPKAEDRFGRSGGIKRPVNLIVHTLGEVNDALAQGRYFFTDLARDGVALYELVGHPLIDPKPLTPAAAYVMAKDYHDEWSDTVEQRLINMRFQMEQARASANSRWLKDAAFTLHQATESAYA